MSDNTLRRARKNFHIVPNDIYDMPPTLTTYAIVVYTCLQRYAGNEDTAFPSFKTLMEKCRIKSDKTLTKAINCLIEHELLKKEIRYCKEGWNKGRRTSNLYTLYDPPEIIKPVNNTGNNDELTVNNTFSLNVNNTFSLNVNNTAEQDTIKEQNTLENKTQLNLTKTKAENEPNESKKETVKLSEVKSSTSNSNEKKKQNHSDKEKKEIKPRAEITAEVKNQIQYNWLKNQLDNIGKPILDEILNTLVNGLRSERPYWTIKGENIPTEELKNRFRERDVTDIQSLVTDITRKTEPIRNPGGYITAALYRYGDGDHTKFTTMYNADVANGLFAR